MSYYYGGYPYNNGYYGNQYNGQWPIYHVPVYNGQPGATYYPFFPQQAQSPSPPSTPPKRDDKNGEPEEARAGRQTVAVAQPAQPAQPQVAPPYIFPPFSLPVAPEPRRHHHHHHRGHHRHHHVSTISSVCTVCTPSLTCNACKERIRRECNCHDCLHERQRDERRELESLMGKYNDALNREKDAQDYIKTLTNAAKNGKNNNNVKNHNAPPAVAAPPPQTFIHDIRSPEEIRRQLEEQRLAREVEYLRAQNHELKKLKHHHHAHHPHQHITVQIPEANIKDNIRDRYAHAYRDLILNQEKEIFKLKKEQAKDKYRTHKMCACGKCNISGCEWHKAKDDKEKEKQKRMERDGWGWSSKKDKYNDNHQCIYDYNHWH